MAETTDNHPTTSNPTTSRPTTSHPTTAHPTASHPTGVTPSTATPATPTTSIPAKTTPTKTTPIAIPEIPTFLQPTPIPAPGMHRGIFKRREDLDISGLSPNPQPGAVPFPKETGTSPSSRCSSVNPNDTLPPTPTPGAQPQPYPPQMRTSILSTRDPNDSLPPTPAPGAQPQPYPPPTQVPITATQDNPRPASLLSGDTYRATTQPLLEDRHTDSERTATTNVSALPTTPADHHNPFPSQPLQGASYNAAGRSGESHPGGYRQDPEAMEQQRHSEHEEGHEETLLGRLGKWVEGVNSRIIETGIAGDVKGKGKEQ